MTGKRTFETIQRLSAELANDKRQLDQLAETNERAVQRIQEGARDYLDYAALGYTIHNLYSIMENSCFRIAKFFENNLDDASWHRELLDRMRLDIPGVRPAFLNEQAYYLLDELRAFRHVFRNLYARPVEGEKIQAVQQKVPEALNQFREAVTKYRTFLQEMASQGDL